MKKRKTSSTSIEKKKFLRELKKSLIANYEFDKKEAKVWEVTLADGLQDEKW